MSIHRNAALAAVLALTALVPAQAAELKAFNASYRASYNNMAANASMSLSPAGSHRWTYRMNVQNALVQLERSAVVDAGGERLRPLSNSESVNMVVRKRSKQGQYDWGAGQATWSGHVKEDRKGPVRLQAGDVDGMTLNLAIVRDALAGKPLRYRLVENGKVKTIAFRTAGRENIQVDGKTLNAIKVDGNDGGNRMSLWVVENVPVPVRILQRDDNGDTIDLRLQSVN
ncbi:DUF3108 domain-containing protein [Luteimonas sp. e5]